MIYYVKYDGYLKDYRIFNAKTNKRLSLKSSFTLIKRFYLRVNPNYVKNISITDSSLIWNFFTYLYSFAYHSSCPLPPYIYCDKVQLDFGKYIFVSVFFSSTPRCLYSPNIPF